MFQFKVSVPGNLNLFGEHAEKYGRTLLMNSIDLRTTLTFEETKDVANRLFIKYPNIRHSFYIPLESFLEFYNKNASKTESLYKNVLKEIKLMHESPSHKMIVQAFLFLFIYIAYKERIKIKPFTIEISTEFLVDNEFACSPSITICFVACFLNWSRLQKGIIDTFDDFIKIIESYAEYYEECYTQCGIAHIVTCIYGSLTQCKNGHLTRILKGMPSMTILLVSPKGNQYLNDQAEQLTELMNTVPQMNKFIFNIFNDITETACYAFEKLIDIHEDKSLDIESRTNRTFAQHKILEMCTRLNQNLLNSLNLSNRCLDDICSIAREYGMCGKYADIDNGRFAYIWCPQQHVDEPCAHIKLLADELARLQFHVTETKLAHEGMKIEPWNVETPIVNVND